MRKPILISLVGSLLFLGISLYSRPVGSIGGQIGMIFAIDAPWRLEPVPVQGGGLAYGPIPIVVTFHDAILEINRPAIPSIMFE